MEAPFDGLLTLSGADRCGACVLGIFVVACVTFLWGKMTLLNSCVDLSFEQFDFIVVSFLVTCRKTLIVLLAVGATPLHEACTS